MYCSNKYILIIEIETLYVMSISVRYIKTELRLHRNVPFRIQILLTWQSHLI